MPVRRSRRTGLTGQLPGRSTIMTKGYPMYNKPLFVKKEVRAITLVTQIVDPQ